jgi:hypothetical protein
MGIKAPENKKPRGRWPRGSVFVACFFRLSTANGVRVPIAVIKVPSIKEASIGFHRDMPIMASLPGPMGVVKLRLTKNDGAMFG